MGYLLCGPVGTGKSFVAQCLAGEIGVPSVILKNFRSKYVGDPLPHAIKTAAAQATAKIVE